ncbi:MAG: MarC family protein [Acetobacterales bacterium]
MIELLVHSFVTFFVILDPPGTAAIFLGLTQDKAVAARRASAVRGVAVATGVLVGFALIGELLLAALGISLPAFRLAGGILLFLLATDMVFARHTGLRSTTDMEDEEAERRRDISVFPLAIPLLAGPGAITSVMLLMARADGDLAAQAVVLSTLLAVMAISLASLFAAGRLARTLGVTGANVASRLLGIILAALAAQFVLDGVRQSFGIG